MYTGDDFIDSSGLFLAPFLATKEALVPLPNDCIMQNRSLPSFRHLECQTPSIISDSIGIPNGSEKKWENEWGTEERNLIHIEEDSMYLYYVYYGV